MLCGIVIHCNICRALLAGDLRQVCAALRGHSDDCTFQLCAAVGRILLADRCGNDIISQYQTGLACGVDGNAAVCADCEVNCCVGRVAKRCGVFGQSVFACRQIGQDCLILAGGEGHGMLCGIVIHCNICRALLAGDLRQVCAGLRSHSDDCTFQLCAAVGRILLADRCGDRVIRQDNRTVRNRLQGFQRTVIVLCVGSDYLAVCNSDIHIRHDCIAVGSCCLVQEVPAVCKILDDVRIEFLCFSVLAVAAGCPALLCKGLIRRAGSQNAFCFGDIDLGEFDRGTFQLFAAHILLGYCQRGKRCIQNDDPAVLVDEIFAVGRSLDKLCHSVFDREIKCTLNGLVIALRCIRLLQRIGIALCQSFDLGGVALEGVRTVFIQILLRQGLALVIGVVLIVDRNADQGIIRGLCRQLECSCILGAVGIRSNFLAGRILPVLCRDKLLLADMDNGSAVTDRQLVLGCINCGLFRKGIAACHSLDRIIDELTAAIHIKCEGGFHCVALRCSRFLERVGTRIQAVEGRVAAGEIQLAAANHGLCQFACRCRCFTCRRRLLGCTYIGDRFLVVVHTNGDLCAVIQGDDIDTVVQAVDHNIACQTVCLCEGLDVIHLCGRCIERSERFARTDGHAVEGVAADLGDETVAKLQLDPLDIGGAAVCLLGFILGRGIVDLCRESDIAQIHACTRCQLE